MNLSFFLDCVVLWRSNSIDHTSNRHLSKDINILYTNCVKYSPRNDDKMLQCTKSELHARAKRMRKEAKLQKLEKLPSIGSLKRLIVKKEPELFNRYRDTYFMYDISRTTRDRYPVTYKDAENKCKELKKHSTRTRKTRAPVS